MSLINMMIRQLKTTVLICPRILHGKCDTSRPFTPYTGLQYKTPSPHRPHEIFCASWAWNSLHAITRLTRPGRMPLCVCREHCHFVTWRNKRRRADTTHFVQIRKKISSAGSSHRAVPSRETREGGPRERIIVLPADGPGFTSA
jgi:hypothetical protein